MYVFMYMWGWSFHIAAQQPLVTWDLTAASLGACGAQRELA